MDDKRESDRAKAISPLKADNEVKDKLNKMVFKDNNQIKAEHKMSKEVVNLEERDARINDQIKGSITKELFKKQTNELIKREKARSIKRTKKAKVKKGSRYKIVKTNSPKKLDLIEPESTTVTEPINDKMLNDDSLTQVANSDKLKLNKKELNDAKEISEDKLINTEVVKEVSPKLSENASEQVKTEIKEPIKISSLKEENILDKTKDYDKSNDHLTHKIKEDSLVKENSEKPNIAIEKSGSGLSLKEERKPDFKDAHELSDNFSYKSDLVKEERSDDLTKKSTLKNDKESNDEEKIGKPNVSNSTVAKDNLTNHLAHSHKNLPKADNFSGESFSVLMSSSSESSGELSSDESIDRSSKSLNRSNEINYQIKNLNDLKNLKNSDNSNDSKNAENLNNTDNSNKESAKEIKEAEDKQD